ncbi:MAG: tRNA-modifying protein YgfZ [Betaproteobacteria bacterium]|nr:tRNA-modifying protein YgfZ [Betaproteobacteria bacterium]
MCGTGGRELLATWLGCEPPAEGTCVAATLDTVGLDGDATATDCRVLGLGGAAWWLLVPLAQADALAGCLARSLPERSSADWDAVEVAAGRPWVESETREAFVPQMLNLDLTGGISFKKGCYPGQEIVARTQYLGKVKRRRPRWLLVHRSLLLQTPIRLLDRWFWRRRVMPARSSCWRCCRWTWPQVLTCVLPKPPAPRCAPCLCRIRWTERRSKPSVGWPKIRPNPRAIIRRTHPISGEFDGR